MRFIVFIQGGITISAECENQRSYKTRVGKTEFTVIVEETESAKENAYQKVKKLIDTNCEKVISEERRQLAHKKLSFEG